MFSGSDFLNNEEFLLYEQVLRNVFLSVMSDPDCDKNNIDELIKQIEVLSRDTTYTLLNEKDGEKRRSSLSLFVKKPKKENELITPDVADKEIAEVNVEEQFSLWAESDFYYRTLYENYAKGLVGGVLEITLSAEAYTQCAIIMQSGIKIYEQARELKKILIHDGIITATTTYNEFINNGTLKDALFKCLACGLAKDPLTITAEKDYGCGVVSHYDLCVNLNTNANFNHKMNQLNIPEGSPLYNTLSKNRRNIKVFVERIMSVVIHSFDLLETPDKQAEAKETKERKKREQKVKESKTPEQLQQEANNSLSQVAKENQEKALQQTIIDVDSLGFDETAQSKDAIDEVDIGLEPTKIHKDNPHQLYETPDSALNILLDYISDAIEPELTSIYDPCCGLNQHIINFFRNRGAKRVSGSDLNYGNERIDFLKLTKDDKIVTDVDYFITNPPFRGVVEFVHQFERLGKPYAVLLPTYALNYENIRPIMSRSDEFYTTLFIGAHRFKVPNSDKPFLVRYGQVWLIKGIEINESKKRYEQPCHYVLKTKVNAQLDIMN